jgi:HEPN domain-containing protein
MSQEGARHRAARLLQGGGQTAQACFQAQQVGEKAIKALLAAEDRDLRSHSLTHLLRALGPEPAVRWQRQARLLDKLYPRRRFRARGCGGSAGGRYSSSQLGEGGTGGKR